jgi:hypothetical protein
MPAGCFKGGIELQIGRDVPVGRNASPRIDAVFTVEFPKAVNIGAEVNLIGKARRIELRSWRSPAVFYSQLR